MNDYPNSLIYLNKALEIQEKHLHSDGDDLTTTYYGIGQTYCSMENYSTALSFYKKVLKIQKKSLASDDPDLSDTRNKIRQMHDLIKKRRK
jgi:tetratricopeptide (TPR) repeat protein